MPKPHRFPIPPVTPDPDPGDDWRARAVCTEVTPELFFPDTSQRSQVAAAKAVCAGCPVADVCLAWALESGADYGVWGGLDEEERRSLRRKLSRPSRAGRPRPTPQPTLADRAEKELCKGLLYSGAQVAAAVGGESVSNVVGYLLRAGVIERAGTMMGFSGKLRKVPAYQVRG